MVGSDPHGAVRPGAGDADYLFRGRLCGRGGGVPDGDGTGQRCAHLLGQLRAAAHRGRNHLSQHGQWRVCTGQERLHGQDHRGGGAVRGRGDGVQHSRGRVLGDKRHPADGAAGRFRHGALCVPGDGQPGHVYRKDREHCRAGVHAAPGEQPHRLAGGQRGGSRARGHPGQVPGGMELHQPGRGQHLHGEGVYQARGRQ